MKKVLALVLSTAMLTGCYQTVNIHDIQDAAIICGGLDKINEIESYILGFEIAYCNDRSSHPINSQSLKRIK